ncbi:maleylpyruvate isomerase family mycothiol-dependent enzyme [Nonomuraea sp. NPDC050783]|uniref:maleylpyruvate isomerase family mycothiol-dependent enzyme n=1 Tax=Nonomuraea sp. NPDC050783 TaxID=3154634 RepID=UPI00346613BA
MTDIFDDLAAECRRFDELLAGLTPDQWAAPSAAPGWSVADVVLHLAQTSEVITDPAGAQAKAFVDTGTTVDGAVDELVAAERGLPPDALLARWRAAALAVPEHLRAQPPGTRLPWVRTPLSAATLATTRLAEHWAHALDVAGPLGLDYPDTARLRHVAWLAHRTLPYAFAVAGLAAAPVFCDLTGTDGTRWTYGDPDAPSRITGPAAEFCRVGARRLDPGRTSLAAEGPHGQDALRVLRTYAA